MGLMADIGTVITIETFCWGLESLEGERIGCRSMEMLCLNSNLRGFC